MQLHLCTVGSYLYTLWKVPYDLEPIKLSVATVVVVERLLGVASRTTLSTAVRVPRSEGLILSIAGRAAPVGPHAQSYEVFIHAYVYISF
jgi:hypothetical protein